MSKNIASGSFVINANGTMYKDTYNNLVTYASTAADGEIVFSYDTQKYFEIRDHLLIEITNPTNTQTLSNKTIVVSNNTVTTASSGNLTSTELNAALAELQADIDTRITASSANTLTNKTLDYASTTIQGTNGTLIFDANAPVGNATSTRIRSYTVNGGPVDLMLPNLSGTILSDSNTATVTNKTLLNDAIQTPSQLDVKQATEANLTTYASTASNGQICYATDTKKYYAIKDGALISLGALDTTLPLALDVNSSSNALRISQAGSGNALVVEDTTTPDSTPTVIDTNGNVIIGGTTAQTIASGYNFNTGTSKFLITGTSSSDHSAGMATYNTSSTIGSSFTFNKSANASLNTHTAVSSGHVIGSVGFAGSDGTTFVKGAFIRAVVDGTVSTGIVPTGLRFSTSQSALGAQTDRMIISSFGNVGIGTTPSCRLDVYQSVGIGAANTTVSQHILNAGFTSASTTSITTAAKMAVVSVTTDPSYSVAGDIIGADIQNVTSITGTAQTVIGGKISYGTNSSATGTINNTYGLFLKPSNGAGITTNSYGIYLDDYTTTGGTITNEYGIYQVRSATKNILNGSLAVGTTSPNANAILDVSSTTKAFLPPRMTTTQKNAIASPVAGMVVYDTTVNTLSLYNGTSWTLATNALTEIFNVTLVNPSANAGYLHYKIPKNMYFNQCSVQIFEKNGISSGSLTIDIKYNTTPNDTGMTSIFSSTPSINFATASDYAEVNGTISTTGVLSGGYLRLDITSVPSGWAGAVQVLLNAL